MAQIKGVNFPHLNANCIHQTDPLFVCMPASTSRGKVQLELVQVPSLRQGAVEDTAGTSYGVSIILWFLFVTFGCCQ